MKRKRTRAKRARGTDLLAKRRQLCDPIIKRLGIAHEFGQLPEEARKEIYLKKSPRPEVVLDASAAQHVRGPAVKEALEAGLDSILLPLPSLNVSVSLAEYCMFVGPFHGLLSDAGNRSGVPGLEALAKKINPVLDASAMECRVLMHANLLCIASLFSRIDTGFFDCRFDQVRLEHNRVRVQILVRIVPPEIVRVRRSGRDPIKAYRTGIPLAGREFDWIRWNPEAVGLKQPAGEYPVLVTSHALRQYETRVPFYSGSDPIHVWSILSLHEPEVEQVRNGQLWVAHEIRDRRFGYWLFRFDGSQFVTDTFQFLTMDGSPEGELLRQNLKMGRRDREYVELDKLETFLASDVREDSELVSILAECGCAHLFDFAKEFEFDIPISGTAEFLRDFLGPERLRKTLTRLGRQS